MKKLTSMTDFVLEQNISTATNIYESMRNCLNYANFLKQPLEIWQFVPCKLVDGVWVVLEEKHDCGGNPEFCSGCKFVDTEYQQAKERCLFEGFDYEYNGKNPSWVVGGRTHLCFSNGIITDLNGGDFKTVEDLVPYNLTLK